MGADHYWYCLETQTAIVGYKARFLVGGGITKKQALVLLLSCSQDRPSIIRARSWVNSLPEG
jgi:hypothetical protein